MRTDEWGGPHCEVMVIALRFPMPASRLARAGAVFTLSTAALIALWLQFQWGGGHTATVLDDTSQIVAPFFAALACGIAGRRSFGRQRSAWWLLGASAAAWGLGSCVWAYYEVLRGQAVPYPSLADVGYLAAVPLAAAGLFAFFPRGRATLRHLLDGLLVAGALLALSWSTVMGALFASSSADLLQNALGLAYPIGDLILLTIAVSLLPSVRGQWRLALTFLCGGIFIYAIGDSLFTYLTTINAYGTVNAMDILWVAGYYAIGMGALMPSGLPDRPLDQRVSALSVVLPYGLLAMSLGVSISMEVRGTFTAFYVWDGVGLIAVMLLRQGLMLREQWRLSRHLEDRVVDRTRELAGRERHFRALIQQSSDSTTLIDAEGRITFQSPAIQPFLGYRPGEVVSRSMAALLDAEDWIRLRSVLTDLTQHPDRVVSVELHLQHRDGSIRIGEATLRNLLDDPDVGGIIVNTRDITVRSHLRDELAYNAVHDGLTGLANRTLFYERLTHALSRSRRTRSGTTVLFVDIDSFKSVNDTKGHPAGDAVLVATGARLGSCVRGSDTVARLGGDEFGIILEGAVERACEVAQRIVDVMHEPVPTAAGDVLTSVSVGVAAAADSADAEMFVRHADIAMYQAKAAGRDRFAIYDPETHNPLLDAMELQADLRVAVQRGELRVHFQPIVNLSDGSPVGAEALLRWFHPTRGLINPDTFIPLAERSGTSLIEIGRWVLHEACRLASPWFAEGSNTSLEWISVNLAAAQLADDALIDHVREALRASGMAPSHLVLELTESGLMTEPERARRLLQAVRELGIRVAVDDFGTGYSSLSYLEQFPIDILKVDKSFVSSARTSQQLSILARTILDLSHSLHVSAIAEGIEQTEQARLFRERRCDMGQGFLFAHPMSADQLSAYLRGDAAVDAALGISA